MHRTEKEPLRRYVRMQMIQIITVHSRLVARMRTCAAGVDFYHHCHVSKVMCNNNTTVQSAVCSRRRTHIACAGK